ncbi:MAG TPA: magnesium transporter [bacterium]|nr:magnesium transporter [bacterium]HNT64204.1 magnesium transporter [bacterium]HOX85194.1 magnesium transporter [bacterium]HPG44353.1 magnesium transporter [bacterium]HPM96911.1 magnesium transporter [bacterium]
MESQDRKEIVENLSYLIQVRDTAKLKNLIVDIHPADLADILSEMEEQPRNYLFGLLESETASNVMIELDEVTRNELVESMGLDRLSSIVVEMDSDDATDILAELPKETAEQVLFRLDHEERAEVEKLIVHEEDTAGGIMALEFVTVQETDTVDEAIQKIRQKAQEVDEIYTVYVTDQARRLTGVLSLKKLLLSKHNMLIRDIMNRDVISVTAEKDQEDVATIVRRYDLVSVPVVDHANRLVGRITIDDIVDVLQEEANEDLSRMAGIDEDEIPQEMSTFRISRFRLPWLLIAFCGEVVSAFILKSFQASLEQIVATAFFIPLIMAMGGNSGIQASTIVVRSIAVEGSSDRWTRLWREMKVSLFNGLIMALLVTLMVNVFFTDDPLFGLVIGVSMLIVMVNAAVTGTVVPYVLDKYDYDPAIATGPFITTSNDVFGLLIYLTLTMGYIRYFH